MEQLQSTAVRKRRGRPLIYLILAILAVAVAGVGFAKTFFYPLATGTFRAAPIVYVHGAFLFGWVAFFLAQSILIHRKKLRLHRKIGWLGAGIAAGVVASTVAVAVYAMRRVAASGDIAAANTELAIILVEMLVFLILVSAAILLRKRPEVHKRLMLLALIQSLAPAWFRFRHYFPEVGNPILIYSFLLADSLVLIAMAYDWRRFGRVHPIYWVAGGGMIAVHFLEVFLSGAPLFQRAAEKAGAILL